MADNGVFSILSGMPQHRSSGTGRAVCDGQDEAGVFKGFVKSFMQAASGKGNGESRQQVARKTEASSHHGNPEQTALERMARLANRGALDRRQLDKMNEDDWQELEEWVLAGAGGLFEPVVEQPGGEGLQLDGELLGQADLGEAVNDALGRAALADLLKLLLAGQDAGPDGGITAQLEQALQTALSEAGSVPRFTPAVVGTLLGIETADSDAFDGDAMKALASALTEALAGTMSESVDGDASGAVAQMLRGRDGADLAEAFQAAMRAAGISSEQSEAVIEEIPEVVLRSLAVKLVSLENADSDAVLLDRLAWDAALRERLAALGSTPASESVADANRAAAQSAEMADVAEGLVRLPGKNGSPASAIADETIPGNEPDVQDLLPSPADKVSVEKIVARAEHAAEGATETPVEPAEIRNQSLSAATLAAGSNAETGIETPEAIQALDGAAPAANQESSAMPVRQPVEVSHSQLVENIERVEQVMRLSVQRGIQRVAVRLDPPELGRVTLQMEMRHGVVNATLRAETADAQQMLMNGVEQLRQNLQVHGIQLNQFEVDLSGGGLAEGQGGAWQEAPKGRQARGEGHREQNEEAEPVDGAASTAAQAWSGEGLNIVV